MASLQETTVNGSLTITGNNVIKINDQTITGEDFYNFLNYIPIKRYNSETKQFYIQYASVTAYDNYLKLKYQ